MRWKKGNKRWKMGQLENNSWADQDLSITPEDLAIFGKISDYMKGCLDIEDVKTDPLYKETDNKVSDLIVGFDRNASTYKANAKYINDNITRKNGDEKVIDMISDIYKESQENDISKITGKWVSEWNEKKLDKVSPDPMSEERKMFISNALVEAESDFEPIAHAKKIKSLKSIAQVRFALPAAAVIVGVILLLKVLLPSGNPNKLYAEYFEPVSAISPVTRSADAAETNSYESAIESYKNKNYQAAATGFSDAIQKDTLNMAARFLLGISRMELGNYDQAENILENVVSNQSEFAKESRWYLGLAYIKTGNLEKARECFKVLAQSPGFYSIRAEKILRRLR
jgi:TolA-binding protein